MTSGDRRDALRTMGALALAPLAALALPPPLAVARNLAPAPAGNYRLTRELVRGLSDGAEIVVTRSWACRFEPVGAGQHVSGEQIDVQVAAPSVLAPLAQIERARKANELFPILLDRAGLIAGPPSAASGPAVAEAVDAAMKLYRRFRANAAVIEDARRFMAELQQTAAAMVSQIPRDLFYPIAGEHREAREVPLPGGAIGRFEVVASAIADGRTGLMASSSREIATTAHGRRTLSRETWTLGLA
ncbi:MAG: hypothetical protein ACR2FJ_00265 [Qipengyuania sp.]